MKPQVKPLNYQLPEFAIYDKDSKTVLYYINVNLLKAQNKLSKLNEIKDLHYLKLEIYEAIKETRDLDLLKWFAIELTELEFNLQKVWGFDRDLRFHRFWITPKCTCPKLDNEDAYPTGFYSYNLNCPLHGVN